MEAPFIKISRSELALVLRNLADLVESGVSSETLRVAAEAVLADHDERMSYEHLRPHEGQPLRLKVMADLRAALASQQSRSIEETKRQAQQELIDAVIASPPGEFVYLEAFKEAWRRHLAALETAREADHD